MPSIIQSTQLGFHYGKRPIFNGLSFSVQAGDMVALLGANGVGKTTLLNTIAGLLKAKFGFGASNPGPGTARVLRVNPPLN